MKPNTPMPVTIALPVLGLAMVLQLTACAGQSSAAKAQQDISNTAASPAQQMRQDADRGQTREMTGSAMDRLANMLAQHHDVYRIGESVVLPPPDSTLFRSDNSMAISHEGNTLLTRISEALKAQEDNRIFIQEYLPAGDIAVQTRKHAMDQAYVIRSELIGRNIEPGRLIVDIEPRTAGAERSSAEQAGKVSLEHRFDLHVVPAP